VRCFVSLLLALALSACSGTGPAAQSAPPVPQVTAVAWPEADRLFQRDRRWLGGDGAFSIHLGGERVLWLFGDSFVNPAGGLERADATMVRNSVAVQHGLDPTTAALRFHWGEGEGGAPRSFFAERDNQWLWPAHGIVLDGALTIFLYRIEKAGGGAFGFETVGWTAMRVDDPDAPPTAWTPRELAVPDTGVHGVVGTALVADATHVYAFGVREPGEHEVWLARWRRADFVAGTLTAPEFWDGDAWGTGEAAVLFDKGATELSVHARAEGGWVEVQSYGFGDGALAVRLAHALHGPWSAPQIAFRPTESSSRGVFCYAGKAHPHLQGAELVATYACNAADPGAILTRDDLYYPRFVKLEL
jgi:hypothetical protein